MALSPSLTPMLFTGAIGLAYFRRIAGRFGRQPWQPKRSGFRLAVLSLALLGLGAVGFIVPGAGLAVAIGLSVGSLLAALALKFTHAEIVDGKCYYTPNPWIGGALSLLLIGRLAMRMGSGGFAAAAAGQQFSQHASPLTFGFAATLIGFYIVERIGLFVQMKRLVAAAPTTGETPRD